MSAALNTINRERRQIASLHVFMDVAMHTYVCTPVVYSLLAALNTIGRKCGDSSGTPNTVGALRVEAAQQCF